MAMEYEIKKLEAEGGTAAIEAIKKEPEVSNQGETLSSAERAPARLSAVSKKVEEVSVIPAEKIAQAESMGGDAQKVVEIGREFDKQAQEIKTKMEAELNKVVKGEDGVEIPNIEIAVEKTETREEQDLKKYNEDKDKVSLDPELQAKLSQTEKQVEELIVRGRDNEAQVLQRQSRKDLEEIVAQYNEPAQKVLEQASMKVFRAKDQTIELDTKSEKGNFSNSFYKSEDLDEVREDKIDANLLKKISIDLGQDGKVYKFTEHAQKNTENGTEQTTDTYFITEYSRGDVKLEDEKGKVFIGFAEGHAGTYLKIFALDPKTIDGKKYTLEELKQIPQPSENLIEPEKPTYNIVDLQMGMEMLSHDLGNKIDIETITEEKILEFNKKLNQDWIEVNNLLSSKLDSATAQQAKFKELKDDLIQKFLVPYSTSDPEVVSPYVNTSQEISERRTAGQKSREKITEKIKTFNEYFKKDGEQLQKLSDQSIGQNLSPEDIRELSDQIDQQLEENITKIKHQKHLAEEGLINSEVLSKSFLGHKTTQEEADDIILIHTDRAKQIADLENGTWQQPRRRRE